MEALCIAIRVYQLVLVTRVVFAWIPRPPAPLQPLVRLVTALTDPVVAPIRKVIPSVPIGGVALDVSIVVLFFALEILQLALCS